LKGRHTQDIILKGRHTQDIILKIMKKGGEAMNLVNLV
jgi:hypothetical protein